MSMTMHVDIVSAETEIYSGTVVECYAPAEMGEVGIHPRHAPLITKLKPGEVRIILQDGEEQSFFVAEVFTGSPGKYVSLKDTLAAFKAILAGEHDDLPEQAFYMVGGIEEAVERGAEA